MWEGAALSIKDTEKKRVSLCPEGVCGGSGERVRETNRQEEPTRCRRARRGREGMQPRGGRGTPEGRGAHGVLTNWEGLARGEEGRRHCPGTGNTLCGCTKKHGALGNLGKRARGCSQEMC